MIRTEHQHLNGIINTSALLSDMPYGHYSKRQESKRNYQPAAKTSESFFSDSPTTCSIKREK